MEHNSFNHGSLLIKGAHSLGVPLDDLALSRFCIYLRELKEWNKSYNLTSINNDFEIITKHFLDSLSVSPFLKDTPSLLDIGSGAGFPGLPIKISLDHLNVLLVDSKLKKVRFVRHVIRLLKLENIEALHFDANNHVISKDKYSSFNAVISRGAFSLSTFLKISDFFLQPEGIAIWMYGSHKKSFDIIDSINKEQHKSFDLYTVKPFVLPFLNHERTISIFKKIS